MCFTNIMTTFVLRKRASTRPRHCVRPTSRRQEQISGYSHKEGLEQTWGQHPALVQHFCLTLGVDLVYLEWGGEQVMKTCLATQGH